MAVGGGGVRMRGSRNNRSAAVAHPPSQCAQRKKKRKTPAYDNRNVRAAAHPHSTLIMIHTKPHKHLPTSAQEPQPNTNTEPKHIVESLSSSLWPDFYFFLSLRAVTPASAASVLYSSLLHSTFSPLPNGFKGGGVIIILKQQPSWVEVSCDMQANK